MSKELEGLIKKLNPLCRQGLQKAAELCVSNTHYNVEIEHLILELVKQSGSDFSAILKHYEINESKVLEDVTSSLDRLKRGNSRTPAMSPQIIEALQEAWVFVSVHLSESSIRSGALFFALLSNQMLRGILLDSAPLLLQVPLSDFKNRFMEMVQSSEENISGDSGEIISGHSSTSEGTLKNSPTPNLDQYTQDITAKARAGELDPVEGRDQEIRQIIDILMRRRQNNPILTGDAGVGKTAVVEGFALRIVQGEVPDSLKNVAVRVLDLGLLQAGAGVKGEFEQRLKNVIQEVSRSPQPIILFVDEAHTLIGAGGQAGQNDAANLLKPALARGELRTIAATTWAEYKKYFEKDHALVRRFQVIKVDEPDVNQAVTMLRSVASQLQEHHGIRILDEAVTNAVKLSHRYITGRKLPDKAVSLLDTACARAAVGQGVTPAIIEDLDRKLALLHTEENILNRENLAEEIHTNRIQEITKEKKTAEANSKKLRVRWEKEKELVSESSAIRDELEGDISGQKKAALRKKLAVLQGKLEKIQDGNPMVHMNVSAEQVASVVSDWTGIPVGKMMTNEVQSILKLDEQMKQRLIGQDHALDAVAKRIRTSRAKLEDPGKPSGVFLLVGPSGVGKTETALTLADALYGGDENVITVNMSEYQEAHSVSSLKGAPPGYVGYGTGGVLTEAVRRRPFSVALLDEVEKAHPDVMELFYQVFDKGTIEDGEGTKVDFKNTIILLTSNIGTDIIADSCRSQKECPSPEELVEKIRPELLKHFKPAFLGRLVIVPYYPLGEEQIKSIVNLKLNKVKERFEEHNPADITFDESLIQHVSVRCTDGESGARNVDNILTHSLLPELSERLLVKMADQEDFSSIHISVEESGQFQFRFEL